MSIEGASPLHQALYAAIEARDIDAFNKLLHEHGGDLLQQFATWAKVPPEARANREATARYVDSLVTIARLFEANGEPRFMQQITGPDDTNPAVVWEREAAEAQALSEVGEYEQSSERLEKLLAAMAGASGNVVDALKPKILGSLGANALHAGDFAGALQYTERAFDASAAVGDEGGLVAYYGNVQSLRLIARLKTDPARAEHLLELRRRVCRAQAAADAGRYAISLDILKSVLPALTADNDGAFRALSSKVHGLIGFNEYRVGNTARAREEIALGLQSAKDCGDHDGVRIYTVSLQTLDRAATSSGR